MGVIQSLLHSTTERVSIPDVRKAGYVQALRGLQKLQPGLARDVGVVAERAWACRSANPERPVAWYRFAFKAPAGFDEPLAFLSIHRSDLEPVRVRVPGHNLEFGSIFVLFHPLLATSDVQSAEFAVSHYALSLPAGRQQLVAVFGLASSNGRLHVAERLPLLADIVTDQFVDVDPAELDASTTASGNGAILEAVVGLSLFVAFADGHYDRKEEQAILSALLDLDDPPQERRVLFLSELQEAARSFRYKKEILDEHCQKAKLGLAPEGASLLVGVLFRVATIDGILHANEEMLLRYVAAQVGVPLSEVQAHIDHFFALGG